MRNLGRTKKPAGFDVLEVYPGLMTVAEKAGEDADTQTKTKDVKYDQDEEHYVGDATVVTLNFHGVRMKEDKRALRGVQYSRRNGHPNVKILEHCLQSNKFLRCLNLRETDLDAQDVRHAHSSHETLEPLTQPLTQSTPPLWHTHCNTLIATHYLQHKRGRYGTS
jgi:hypothetical protein